MKPRGAMPARERQVRSRLAQLAHAGEFLRGSLTLMRHTCGKSGCRCACGEKHESWYLGYSEEGQKRMVSIRREALADAREWVGRYREVRRCLEALCQIGLGRLRASRRPWR